MRYKYRSGCDQHIQNEKMEFVCGNLSVARLDLAKSLSRMGGNYFEGLSPFFQQKKTALLLKSRRLLDHDDVDAESPDEHGRTVLACVAERDHETVVRVLLEGKNKALVNAEDPQYGGN